MLYDFIYKENCIQCPLFHVLILQNFIIALLYTGISFSYLYVYDIIWQFSNVEYTPFL